LVHNASKQWRSSLGLRLKKASSDQRSRRGVRQKRLFKLKGRTYWRQRQSLPLSPTHLDVVALQASHVSASSTTLMTSILIRCSSYSTRVTDRNFLKLDVLRRWASPTIMPCFPKYVETESRLELATYIHEENIPCIHAKPKVI